MLAESTLRLRAVAAAGRETCCDLCGAAGHRVLFEASDRRYGVEGSFAVVRCTSCGLARTHPPPVDLARYYAVGGYYAYRPPPRPGARALARVRARYETRRPPMPALLTSRLVPGLPSGPPGRLLDIGCGSGAMLMMLERAGWSCRGVEIDAGAVAAAHAAGLAVDAGDLLDQKYPDGRFDAVRFWHSLEHLESPLAQLEEAHRILGPRGTLTIGVPNIGSALTRVFGDRSFSVDVPRHLWHFNRRTLSLLVARAGFIVERVGLVSGSSALLGTAQSLRGKPEQEPPRWMWLAALPVAVTLDLLGLGDAIELHARRR